VSDREGLTDIARGMGGADKCARERTTLGRRLQDNTRRCGGVGAYWLTAGIDELEFMARGVRWGVVMDTAPGREGELPCYVNWPSGSQVAEGGEKDAVS